jgi:hypothetical protein
LQADKAVSSLTGVTHSLNDLSEQGSHLVNSVSGPSSSSDCVPVELQAYKAVTTLADTIQSLNDLVPDSGDSSEVGLVSSIPHSSQLSSFKQQIPSHQLVGNDTDSNADDSVDEDQVIVSDTDSDSDNSVDEDYTRKSKLYVKVSSNMPGKCIFDKKHYCMYCNKASTNLSKHLMNKHKNEDYVKQINMQDKKSKERKFLLEKVRNLGDYAHNCEVWRKGEGEIIPWRCPPEPVDVKEYLSCPDCFASFQRTQLWRHHKVCKACTRHCKEFKYRNLCAEASLLLPSSEETNMA